MIQIFSREKICASKWDNFILNSRQRNIYAYSWYLDLTSGYWSAVVDTDSNGNFIAVLPFQWRTKFGIAKVHQDEAVRELGFYSSHDYDPVGLIHELRIKYRFISSYVFNVENVLHSFPYEISYHLDLSGSYSSLHKNYSLNRRRNLNVARKAGIRIEKTENIDSLISMFKKFVSPKIYGIQEHQYSLLRTIYRESRRRELSFMLHANHYGSIVSSALFLISHNRLIYFFGASTDIGKELNAQTMLLDVVVQMYAGQSMVLDFEGGSIPGLDYFYKSFGAKQMKLFRMREYRINPLLKYFLSFRTKIIKSFNGLLA